MSAKSRAQGRLASAHCANVIGREMDGPECLIDASLGPEPGAWPQLPQPNGQVSDGLSLRHLPLSLSSLSMNFMSCAQAASFCCFLEKHPRNMVCKSTAKARCVPDEVGSLFLSAGLLSMYLHTAT